MLAQTLTQFIRLWVAIALATQFITYKTTITTTDVLANPNGHPQMHLGNSTMTCQINTIRQPIHKTTGRSHSHTQPQPSQKTSWITTTINIYYAHIFP